jgi:cell division protein ZipA
MDLPWILLFISVILIAMIAWNSSGGFTRRKRDQCIEQYHEEIQDDLFGEEDYFEDELAPVPPPKEIKNQILSINLKAPEGRYFAGEQLVIHLNRAGLRFGALDIFHFENLFSLASAFEPGTFDLDRLENLKTAGLIFFMETGHLDDVREAFETMLDTAQHLAEQLKAELFDDQWRPLNSETIERYYDQIEC